jgi:SNF2 family DNA or RNA helicase
MLRLQFSVRAGRIQISCDPDSTPQLNALRLRFLTSTPLTAQAFDVGIEDLLVNLRELALWPAEDTDVRWQPELRALVESNAADAAVARARLKAPARAAAAEVTLDGGWAAPLTDFQERDFSKLLELNHGANFSVPGAGKTRVALAILQARRDRRELSRALVVCPKSAFESWEEEAQLCFPEAVPRIAIYDGGVPPDCDILLVNYERLPDAQAALLHWLRAKPALLVLDEAHRMKLGPKGAWGAVCLALAPYAARRLILTGTPAPNGAEDLENLMAFVWPGQGRMAVAGALAGKTLRDASVTLRPLFSRTTKEELDLPPLTILLRRIDLPPLHRDLYQALLGQMSARWRGGERDTAALGRILLYLLMAATTPALLATGASRYEPLPYRIPPLVPPDGSSLAELMRDLPLYEVSPKYAEVEKIVSVNSAENRKTLVWSTFVRNLTSLASLLQEYEPAVVHGGTEDRLEQLRRFRFDGSCRVLLSNPATLGEGISLHHVCHDAVYVDRDFAAGRFLQSLDRIHRLGLAPDIETRVTVLVSSETIDELVEQRLAIKLAFMAGILDDPSVQALADLQEEPSETAGMDGQDLAAFIGYLRDAAASGSNTPGR